MRLHPNAKLTPAARLLLVQRVQQQGSPVARAAREAGVSRQTAYKWMARYQAGGVKAMSDRSSRPLRIPIRTPQRAVQRMEKLRRRRKPAWEIALELGVPVSTVSRHLKELGLGRTGITDEGLVCLKGLTNLQSLDLSWCSRITGAGLEHLKELTSLRDLSLYKTRVTDAGLIHLKGMINLENLALPDVGTSDAGVAELKKVLTKCEINRLDY